jgi:3-oxoacyl-[acyl-carrier protein] reductase
MDLGLDGETALVTASSSGLGLASARALADEDANVTVCGRDEDRLAEARSDLEGRGDGGVLAHRADVTDPDQVTALVEATVEEFGGLDHLVTSAGGVPPGDFDSTSRQAWYDAHETLVMSVVDAVREARPHLSEGSTITCITSTSVREPIDDLLLSNAVRRGVVGLAKSLSRELAPGVRTNVVMPGPHETARIEELVQAAVERGEYDSYEEGLDSWADPVPLDRIGDPRELGDAVAFLASDRASFLNGVALPVDGGRLRS